MDRGPSPSASARAFPWSNQRSIIDHVREPYTKKVASGPARQLPCMKSCASSLYYIVPITSKLGMKLTDTGKTSASPSDVRLGAFQPTGSGSRIHALQTYVRHATWNGLQVCESNTILDLFSVSRSVEQMHMIRKFSNERKFVHMNVHE
jgi:hypothetical protein